MSKSETIDLLNEAIGEISVIVKMFYKAIYHSDKSNIELANKRGEEFFESIGQEPRYQNNILMSLIHHRDVLNMRLNRVII